MGCNGICRLDVFPLKLLHNKVVHKVWSKYDGCYRIIKDSRHRHDGRTKRYTKEHEKNGLARCRICEYITANPVSDIYCICCAFKLSRKLRNTNG